MKKIIKTAAVLIALALMSAACSKVKTTSLIGTYKSGKATMTVGADGSVGFESNGETGVLDSLNEVYTKLIPWDLTSEKQSYDYSAEADKYESSPSGGSNHKVNLKFNFTKDKEKINCKVGISGIPEGKGDNGSVTFTK